MKQGICFFYKSVHLGTKSSVYFVAEVMFIHGPTIEVHQLTLYLTFHGEKLILIFDYLLYNFKSCSSNKKFKCVMLVFIQGAEWLLLTFIFVKPMSENIHIPSHETFLILFVIFNVRG